MEADGILIYKRYRIRDDEDIGLIKGWHNRFPNVHLLELFVFFVDMCGMTSSEVGGENASSTTIRTNTRRLIVDLNMSSQESQEESNPDDYNDGLLEVDHESHVGSIVGDLMMDHYQAHPVFDDEEPEEEPAISKLYDHPAHYSTLNLDAMNLDWFFSQGGLEDDPTCEFEIGQQFDNKEEAVTAVKMYNIRRTVEYKILESDQLKYDVHCTQDYGRLNSKVVAKHIFSMVKADPTINIRVLQGAVENHFGYKASYRKVWLTK
ncbi:uncharacterized protein LOC107621010 [Arachis ipaensis]|uniref:Transposase MuDR plant domain-containing protein n=1 Tax=Arachis hypogaea TaxID=3818 RepID=A0A444X578_ARAHY|nr:uncharacterized protein LOC107621010 [Arachis ipaensis]RYQ84847.1 hypothetical protein Ahy_B10g104338 [Arachis hypogaea]